MKLHSQGLASLLAAGFLVSTATVVRADVPPQTVLYGIKPGTELRGIRAAYGKPTKTERFDDGWQILIYFFEDHYFAVETAPDDPEYIVRVQLTGDANPPGKGMNDINLGDSVDKVVRVFGEPLERSQATDETTHKIVPNTWYLEYSNGSFEEVDGKVTSIKTYYLGRKDAASAGAMEATNSNTGYSWSPLTAPLGGIGQHEQVQTGEQEQRERKQR
ncbi:MAG TPA: hypothetical protein PLF26_18790 [Blastocatellia bacterium]|nr:hypothetical protein [Blastocatellia bacterium]